MKRIGLGYVWLAVTTLVVTSGLLLVYKTGLPPEVPIWYSLPWGQDQLAHPMWLWLIPALIGSVTAAVVIGSRMLRNDQLLLNLWTAGGMVVQLILSLAVIRIVWLVIF